jgi:hypothetical protein
MSFETLPDEIIRKILECFQTRKIIKISDNLTRYEFNQLIVRHRKNLINGRGIYTDVKTIINLAGTCKRFNDIINKSDIGNLILAIQYSSKDITVNDNLEHISYCKQTYCKNVCHYVNKHMNHSNLLKKVVVCTFNDYLVSSKKHKEDPFETFRPYLNNKQIESYYKIKKNANKINEETKSCEEFLVPL